jgi:hypothetical protein
LTSKEEEFHVQRVKDRLETQSVKDAFNVLFNWLSDHPTLNLLPLSRGNFSAIHFSTTASPRPYADCEFGFKGAKDHMRFWFRKPGFNSGLLNRSEILTEFPDANVTKIDEITYDIPDTEKAEKIISYVQNKILDA